MVYLYVQETEYVTANDPPRRSMTLYPRSTSDLPGMGVNQGVKKKFLWTILC